MPAFVFGRRPRQLIGGVGALLLCVSSAFGADARGVATPIHTAMRPLAGIVSIVIDDIGNLRDGGLRAIELPGSVTYAILPHTPYGATLARLAHSLDKEVIVHVPMEAISHKRLGRGGLTANLSRQQFEQRTLAAISSVPHAQGVSNHMGSRLTAMHRPMQWLMQMLRARDDWMFLDSRTTADSVAETTARVVGIRTTYRDVFLDNEISVTAIRARFKEVIARARTRGSAVAIGHPYPETLQVLAEELPRLVRPTARRVRHERAERSTHRTANSQATDIRLVPLSQLIARRSKNSWRLLHTATSLTSRGHAH